jgi:hypothetical protein
MFLGGSPDRDIEALLADAADEADYAAPVGTIWSWPQKNQRFSVRASSELYLRLSEAASHHAEPEICSHIHFYRDQEALVQWFDAFQSRFLFRKPLLATGWSASRRPLAVPYRPQTRLSYSLPQPHNGLAHLSDACSAHLWGEPCQARLANPKG